MRKYLNNKLKFASEQYLSEGRSDDQAASYWQGQIDSLEDAISFLDKKEEVELLEQGEISARHR